MNFPILASSIVFVIWLAVMIHKSNSSGNKSRESFWEKEIRADATSGKPLDDIAFITIPMERLHPDTLANDPRAAEYVERFTYLSNEKVVNLTGITNTDLKLKYGAPNIEKLMRYDQNYTTLARTLQEYAQLLYDKGHIAEAKDVLEFALETHTDVSGSYRLISEIYKSEGNADAIRSLLPEAEKLNSVMKKHIIDILMDYYKTTPSNTDTVHGTDTATDADTATGADTDSTDKD